MHALHCIITSLICNDLGTLVQGVSVTTGACIFIFVVLFTVAVVASIIFHIIQNGDFLSAWCFYIALFYNIGLVLHAAYLVLRLRQDDTKT